MSRVGVAGFADREARDTLRECLATLSESVSRRSVPRGRSQSVRMEPNKVSSLRETEGVKLSYGYVKPLYQ